MIFEQLDYIQKITWMIYPFFENFFNFFGGLETKRDMIGTIISFCT